MERLKRLPMVNCTACRLIDLIQMNTNIFLAKRQLCSWIFKKPLSRVRSKWLSFEVQMFVSDEIVLVGQRSYIQMKVSSVTVKNNISLHLPMLPGINY